METLTVKEAALAGGLVGGAIGVVSFFAVVYYVLLVIACWKIFQKAGEPGWKCLIPIYNQYILYKIVGMKKWFWAVILASFAISFVTSLMGFNNENLMANNMTVTNIIAALMVFAAMVFAIVISIMNYYRISRVFGHGWGYTIGLILLNSIFLLILGFGKSKYDKKLAKTWE